ncbi:hypothetical protein OCGS_0902 [Oceaniovalibus guishaninsula JLT2003]|uniref:NAD(FAD)-utilizing dehydrogenase n=1 Tax=Oceaniovalibus guishaninsula JLT2003 TaxID=1231392 RepID=K2HEA8_9RHOB|nr:hypothetical protein OCGS_0902 [Oceaniovalibus guishaninsula JLT2003]
MPWLTERGIAVVPFQPANAGLTVDWSDHMAPFFGTPLKNVVLSAGTTRMRGECVLTRRGLEGGAIYAVSRDVLEGADLTLDLLPDRSKDRIRARLATATGSLGNRLRKGLGLPPAARALALEFARPFPRDPAILKRLPVRHGGLRPLDEAISSAGGVRWDAVDDGLMLTALPGIWAAGEMLDWEAPTGGYLLTACLATGRHAGRAAARWLAGATPLSAGRGRL